MKKLAQMKKRLVRLAVVWLIAIAVSGGLLFGAMTYEESATTERDDAQHKAQAVISDNDTLKQRIAQSSQSYAIFEKINHNNPSGNYTLNRDEVPKILNEMKTQFPVSVPK